MSRIMGLLFLQVNAWRADLELEKDSFIEWHHSNSNINSAIKMLEVANKWQN